MPTIYEKNKLGFNVIGVIILVIVLAIALPIIAGLISILKKSPSTNLLNTQVSTSSSIPQQAGPWSTYNNTQFGMSFDYPSGWEVEEIISKTVKGNNWLQVAVKEKQFREGMGTSWINVSAITTTDLTDVPILGQKTGETIVNGKKVTVWEDQGTNQKFLVIPTSSSVYVIRSRLTFDSKIKDVEQVYNQLVSSFKTGN